MRDPSSSSSFGASACGLHLLGSTWLRYLLCPLPASFSSITVVAVEIATALQLLYCFASVCMWAVHSQFTTFAAFCIVALCVNLTFYYFLYWLDLWAGCLKLLFCLERIMAVRVCVCVCVFLCPLACLQRAAIALAYVNTQASRLFLVSSGVR